MTDKEFELIRGATTPISGQTFLSFDKEPSASLISTRQNEYTYTGQRLDPESKLYHFHFRQYDATAGIWTTTDPIGILGGLNLYGYVGNNPLNYRDIFELGRNPDEDGYNDCCGAGNAGQRNANDNGRNNDRDSYTMSEIVITDRRYRGRTEG